MSAFDLRRLVFKLATTALVTTVMVVSGGVAASSSAGPTASPKPTAIAVEDCGLGRNLVRPKTLTVACADANILVTRIAWASWGPTKATASATYTWNTCVPYCAASKTWDRTTAAVTLSDPVRTSEGVLFEKLSSWMKAS